MKKILLSIAVAAPLVFVGCASSGGTAEPSVNQLISQAEAEVQAAKDKGMLWNTTQKHLDAAKQAQADLDTDKAVKAAKRAIKEARLAQEQATAIADAKPRYIE